MVMKKPKDPTIAYQFWKNDKRLLTKPVNQGGYWTNEPGITDPKSCHLFVFGKSLDFELNGRTLIRIEGVDASGAESDGYIDHDINDDQVAIQRIINDKNSDMAYSWCRHSKRLIQKPPEKRSG